MRLLRNLFVLFIGIGLGVIPIAYDYYSKMEQPCTIIKINRPNTTEEIAWVEQARKNARPKGYTITIKTSLQTIVDEHINRMVEG